MFKIYLFTFENNFHCLSTSCNLSSTSNLIHTMEEELLHLAKETKTSILLVDGNDEHQLKRLLKENLAGISSFVLLGYGLPYDTLNSRHILDLLKKPMMGHPAAHTCFACRVMRRNVWHQCQRPKTAL